MPTATTATVVEKQLIQALYRHCAITASKTIRISTFDIYSFSLFLVFANKLAECLLFPWEVAIVEQEQALHRARLMLMLNQAKFGQVPSKAAQFNGPQPGTSAQQTTSNVYAEPGQMQSWIGTARLPGAAASSKCITATT